MWLSRSLCRMHCLRLCSSCARGCRTVSCAGVCRDSCSGTRCPRCFGSVLLACCREMRYSLDGPASCGSDKEQLCSKMQHWGLFFSYTGLPTLSSALSPSNLGMTKQVNHLGADVQANAVSFQFLFSSWLMDSSKV